MQKLDEDKKLFLEAQRSDKRYGFININVLNEGITPVTMDIAIDGIHFTLLHKFNIMNSMI